jgi:hypothetical protein
VIADERRTKKGKTWHRSSITRDIKDDEEEQNLRKEHRESETLKEMDDRNKEWNKCRRPPTPYK